MVHFDIQKELKNVTSAILEPKAIELGKVL